ncbi:hypothetical protein PIB30_078068, partial [Stylosanthes scabra]|nr:hypothetical protein [Stylosanthes scabra]
MSSLSVVPLTMEEWLSSPVLRGRFLFFLEVDIFNDLAEELKQKGYSGDVVKADAEGCICGASGFLEEKMLSFNNTLFDTGFFRCLDICHIVFPEGEESPEKIKYQAVSPNESPL